MLKLVIADDERVIRETISRLIDWQSMGIELVGLCRDGIEAYNMILDESPDIVLTDIRMPGLTGLELVKEISQTDRQLQFIILSGYGEFEYAREAMQYGVKHYLLKPCSEEKLKESIRKASEDCYHAKRIQEEALRQNAMLRVVYQDVIYRLLMEGLSWDEEKGGLLQRFQELMKFYGRYQDFGTRTCYLYYAFFLEWEKLDLVLQQLKESGAWKNTFFYAIYVKNTLMLFSYEKVNRAELEAFCRQAGDLIEISEKEYDGLPKLLETVLYSVIRYDTIYVIHDYKAVAILNDQGTLRCVQDICHRLESGADEVQKCLEEILVIVKEASRAEFLQVLGNSICIRLSAIGGCSMLEAADFLKSMNQESGLERLRELTIGMIIKAQGSLDPEKRDYGMVSERVMQYVEEHIAESELTLKKIAEECLYMNVDYVSRQFRKATGKKFSQFLAEQRVQRAKELLVDEDSKIQYVAEQVGCGNNPQYFTQIFKKIEGVTPGKWATQMRERV